jgi:hypothetical protein
MGSSPISPKPNRPRKRSRLLYEHRISLYSFLVALPGLLVSEYCLDAALEYQFSDCSDCC